MLSRQERKLLGVSGSHILAIILMMIFQNEECNDFFGAYKLKIHVNNARALK